MSNAEMGLSERVARVRDGLAAAMRDPECPVQFSPLLMEARNLLSSPVGVQRDGWRLVPVEPTREQFLAFKEAFEGCPDGEGYFHAFDAGYTAAVNASPASPRAEDGASKWAAGYAAGKASLQAELDWYRGAEGEVRVTIETHGQQSCYYGRLVSIEPYVAEKREVKS